MAISFNKEVILEAIQEVIAENERTDSHVVTRDPKSKVDILKVAKDKGVSTSEFQKKVQDSKPGDTFNMEEDYHENPNDDSNMAKSQLYAIAKYAIELLQLIKDGDQLDAWVQAKITKASDYIDAVQHYLEGEEYLDANQEESEEELAEGDYQARTKEDLVFQYLRDAWQFGATKGRDVNPDEELSTMADSLLANLPDYDSADRVNEQAESLQSIGEKIEGKLKALGLQTHVFGGEFEVPKNARDQIAKNNKLGALAYSRDKSIFAGHPEYERLEVIVHKDHLEDLKKIANEFKMPSGSVQAFAGTDFVRLRHTADVVGESVELDEIKKAEFEKIKPGKELQLRGYGVVKVIENDGIVMKIKDSLDKVHTINLGQYNEKFLKEARKRGEKTVRTELDATITKMKELAKKYKEGDKSVVSTLKDLTVKKKALSAELEKIVAGIGAGQEYKGEVDETIAEGVSCCGRCGRVHESAQDCKKPYISKDSPRHCKNKK